MKRRSSVALLGAAALVAGSALISGPAVAGSNGGVGEPRVITDGLFTPLKLAVNDHGTAYVSQNFIGELTKVARDGTKTPFASAPGEEVGGVSEHDGTVYWTTTGEGSAKMFAQRRGGEPRQIADIWAHENSTNPDQGTTYGFRDLPAECAAQFPADNPASYTGAVDSHPYATLVTDRHKYVADAGANAIFEVGRHGRVTTVATLPGVGTVVTAEAAEAQQLPECAVGHTYYFEFVPTDIEQSRDGRLYVTSLPGGPEDASLGARGAVYELKAKGGGHHHKSGSNGAKVKKVAGGFVGAVDLALLPDRKVAVAELFGGAEGQGQVSLFKLGSRSANDPAKRQTLALASPAAVEWVGGRHSGKLYVTTDAFVGGEPGPTGKLQVLSIGSHRH
ncbi:MAG: ScyD/ScyE family protein [Aeromicrobium sp.]|nr:ScyD/ScyE family protein [Aeromicrobium sp.]